MTSALLGVRVVDMRQPSSRFATILGVLSGLWDWLGGVVYPSLVEIRVGLGELPRLGGIPSSGWVNLNQKVIAKRVSDMLLYLQFLQESEQGTANKF